ncbi:MAG TPA: hypothetical protein VFL16_15625 [Steroidobacteraceae bacterium]|nr:hypothetical protein [Steroidobacteraceae bacterium]
MNRSSKNATCITARDWPRAWLLALGMGVVTLLTACSGHGDVGLGSGQAPDPATVDFPIFYIRHQIPMENGQIAQDNVTRVRPFVEDDDDATELYSATLWKRDRASPGAPETELTARLRTDAMGGTPDDRYDIKDLAVSPDGLKVAFAMRGPLADFDEDEPPTWNIWEYDIATDDLHRVIRSDIIAEDGQDVAPNYLPDGRILFSSTRQRQSKAVLLDENKQQFEATTEAGNESAFVLHVMNGDGTDIHQITFNPSSDLYSSVLQNGRVLFTRWDRSAGHNSLDLYTTNPDGTDTQLYYGALEVSHRVGTPVPLPTAQDPTPEAPLVEFVRAREMSNGKLMVLARERTNVDFGGNLLIIDANNFVENDQLMPASAGTPGFATTNATLNAVATVPGPSKGGRFQSGFPLWDGTGRILVSWSQCRLLDVGGTDPTRIIPCDDAKLADDAPVPAQAAPPLYSIWMFNPSQNTILPIMPPVEGVMVTEAIAAQPRTPLPAVIVDKKAPGTLNPDYVSESVGILNIRSVYEIMGVDQARLASGARSTIAALSDPTNPAYAQRQVRFVRIEKRVSIPDDDDIADPDNSAFGGSNIMREIVAYAPVEPDGSIEMKVPANVAFQISLLDQNARMITRHNDWMSVRPGEVLECTGCHNVNVPQGQRRSHGRKGSFPQLYAGASGAGVAWPGAVNTVSPEPGDTMAMARARTGSSCIDGNMIEHCGAQSLNPSANVVYDEIWKPAAPLTDSFAFTYQNLNTKSPASPGCFPWTTTCRITIHYADIGARPGHIMPLWTVERPASLLPAGTIDTNNDNVMEDTYTCTSCHSRTDVLNQVQVPAASLELLPGAQCANDALRDLTYCQLLEDRDELVLDNGAVVTRQSLVPLDMNGQPTEIIPLLPHSMNANNSRGSRFFQVMNNATHTGMLSTAELRLLSEWLDIGAQYYNDPFPPTPQN